MKFEFRKDVDVKAVAKKIADFLRQDPTQNLADVRLMIRHGVVNSESGPTPANLEPSDIGARMAQKILEYASARDEYFVATAEITFAPKSRR